MAAKTRIVFFASNPDQATPLKLDEEIRAITVKVQQGTHRDVLDLVSCWATRPDDLLRELNRHRPCVVHFSGHGSPAGEIVLMDDARRIKTVSADALRALFEALHDPIRLVVLNACYSKVQARAIAEVVDCVIGMNAAIGDEAAIAFASSFYRAISFGRSIGEAFKQGRVALLLEGIGEAQTPELLVRPGVDPASVFLIGPDGPQTRESGDLRAYCTRLAEELSQWRGLGAFAAKRLEQIYVPHQLLDKSQAGRESPDPEVLGRLLDAPATGSVYLVEGNAGSGKTILLQSWAVSLARACLKSAAQGRVPLYLPLGWVERRLGRGPWTASPAELAAQRFSDEAGHGSPSLSAHLANAIQDGSAVMLLDALDEVSEPALPSFLDWWHTLHASRGTCPVVISSRPRIQSGGIKVHNKLFIRPFNRGQQTAFINKWFAPNPQIDAAALQIQVRDARRLQSPDVAGNPLFLTLMCVEYESRGALSATPGRLLDQFVRLLLEGWDKERGVQRTAASLDLKLQVLEAVATRIFEQERGGLGERELLEVAGNLLRRRGSGVEAQALIDDIVNTSGLLRQDREGAYPFCHNLFLEYFAARDKACGLGAADEKRWLEAHFFDARYETVIQFYQELRFEG